MYLQLAEGEDIKEAINPWVFIPDPTGRRKGIYVREDHFDHLPNSEYNKMLRNLAPYQDAVQSGQLSESEFLADKKAKKQKREEKKEAKKIKSEATGKGAKKKEKIEKKKARTEKKKASAELKRSKGEAKKTKAEAKKIKAEGRQAPGEEEEDVEAGSKAITKAKSLVGKLIKKYAPGGGAEAEEEETPGTQGRPGRRTKPEEEEEKKPFYKNPWVIGGAVAGAGLLIWAVTRKK